MKNKQLIECNREIIKQAQAQIDKLIKEDEKLELSWFNGIGNKIYTDGSITKANSNYPLQTQSGGIRETYELAEIASKNMLTRNRLEAWAMEHDPMWIDGGVESYASYIYIGSSGEYRIGDKLNTRVLGAVMMSKETAEWICERLNDGRIEL